MNVDTRSSSNDLSSAPSSDIESPYPGVHSHPYNAISSRDIQNTSTSTGASTTKLEGLSAHAQATRQDSAVAKPKKTRKKKDVDPNAAAQEKPKKPRKPRDSTSAASTARKRQKTGIVNAGVVSTEHTTQTTSLSASTLVQPTSFTEAKPSLLNEAAKITQNGFLNHNSAMNSGPPSPPIPRYQTTPQPKPSQPRSRNIFDPVRGIERASEQPQTNNYPSLNETPPRQPFRPSASPAISSILNPTDVEEISSVAFHSSLTTAPIRSTLSEEIKPANVVISSISNLDGAAATTTGAEVKKAIAIEKPPTETDTKPKRAKEQPPPAPSGSGLLNSTFFGGDSTVDKSESSTKGTSIMLHIDLKDPKNKIFNFARMAEEKYGFAAIYPKQAAQKKRLAEVAAQGAALEKAASIGKREGTSAGDSGDEDLSVDIDRDSDNDGDIAMGGLNGTNDNSGTDGPVPKQRKKRRDEYDADDPFVDDSEMLWEAQAAASKDGFFVYCGPLVPEGDKASVERVDGSAKRGRGRGRGGGGPGSRGGRASTTNSTPAEGSARASGVSSRGGGVTRKPRITKAERLQRDLEKKQREQMALASKPPTATA